MQIMNAVYVRMSKKTPSIKLYRTDFKSFFFFLKDGKTVQAILCSVSGSFGGIW